MAEHSRHEDWARVVRGFEKFEKSLGYHLKKHGDAAHFDTFLRARILKTMKALFMIVADPNRRLSRYQLLNGLRTMVELTLDAKIDEKDFPLLNNFNLSEAVLDAVAYLDIGGNKKRKDTDGN